MPKSSVQEKQRHMFVSYLKDAAKFLKDALDCAIFIESLDPKDQPAFNPAKSHVHAAVKHMRWASKLFIEQKEDEVFTRIFDELYFFRPCEPCRNWRAYVLLLALHKEQVEYLESLYQ